MTKRELQNTITSILFDKELAMAIQQSDTDYSELELCSMCYRYSCTYDQRLNLLSLIKVNATDENLSDYISRLTEQIKSEAADFYRKDDSCVYELQIMLDKYAYTERYLCRDAKSAVELIPKWHKRYGDTPKKVTEYIIEKRKILNNSDEISEDDIARCHLDCNMEICRYYSEKTAGFYGNYCDGECEECTEKYCVRKVKISFPDIFKTGELVCYREPFGAYGYGIVITEYSDCETSYIIPLDGRNICYDISKAHLDHIHVPKLYVRHADESEISGGKGSQLQLYRDFVKYLSENQIYPNAVHLIKK